MPRDGTNDSYRQRGESPARHKLGRPIFNWASNLQARARARRVEQERHRGSRSLCRKGAGWHRVHPQLPLGIHAAVRADYPADESDGPGVKPHPAGHPGRHPELPESSGLVGRLSASSPSLHKIGKPAPSRLPGIRKRQDSDVNIIEMAHLAAS